MSDGRNGKFSWRFAAIGVVVCLAAGTSFADTIMATAKTSWGTVKVTRDGIDINFISGMELKSGDIIKTNRKSGAIIEWKDRTGETFAEEEFFGLPGEKGCADAEGERGEAKAEIKGKDKPDNKRETISKVEKGTSRIKTVPGKEEKAKDHFAINKKTVVKKIGTEYALTYDLGSELSSLSTLAGSVEFDNIEWTSLPSSYFTNPSDKSFDTLNLDAILSLSGGIVDILDVLGAGHTVTVSADFYSIAASPPSTPAPGKAPIHLQPGGLSPEPATLSLLILGGLAVLRRRRK
jgi:hypothetical protein